MINTYTKLSVESLNAKARLLSMIKVLIILTVILLTFNNTEIGFFVIYFWKYGHDISRFPIC